MENSMAGVLRDAIKKNGKPLLQIARGAGVPVPGLWEFMQGHDMRLKNASKIADYLGLELKPTITTVDVKVSKPKVKAQTVVVKIRNSKQSTRQQTRVSRK